MKIGTKSVLFGAHCFFIHPWFVAYSWYKLYGFPFDPRLWFAFFLHDIGYIGKPNMDGEEGERHPYLGARIMSFLFDKKVKILRTWLDGSVYEITISGTAWYNFTLYHSRFLAKKNGERYSKLCVADKLAIYYTPSWLYLPMVKFTGEIKEYMKDMSRNSGGELKYTSSPENWYRTIQFWVLDWVNEHKDLKEDTKTTVRKPRKNDK